MARRHRSNPPVRRKRVWAREFNSIPSGSGAPITGALDVLSDFRDLMGADTVGTTVAAVKGRILATGGSATSVGDPPGFIVGLRVGSTLSPPQDGPRGEPGADWMYVDTVFSPFVDSNPNRIDAGAQRKVDEIGRTLYLCYDRRDATGDEVFLHYDISVLLLLP